LLIVRLDGAVAVGLFDARECDAGASLILTVKAREATQRAVEKRVAVERQEGIAQVALVGGEVQRAACAERLRLLGVTEVQIPAAAVSGEVAHHAGAVAHAQHDVAGALASQVAQHVIQKRRSVDGGEHLRAICDGGPQARAEAAAQHHDGR
jgi:hypothetical protein